MSAIIIEGVDGTGKTTLAQAIAKRGFTYQHYGSNSFATYRSALSNARRNNYVFDRLHVSELVYGSVVRDHPLVSIEQLRLLNRILRAGGGCIILCHTSQSDIVRNWKNAGGDQYIKDAEVFLKLDQEYRQLLQDELADFTFVYDYTFMASTPFIEDVVRSRREQIKDLTVNGTPGARYLVVGECLLTAEDVPFCSMDGWNGLLNESLWEAEYRENELMFINAYNRKGTADLSYAGWELLNQPKVIALGKKAQTACDKACIPFLRAPHPRSIKANKRDEYVELLRSFRE